MHILAIDRWRPGLKWWIPAHFMNGFRSELIFTKIKNFQKYRCNRCIGITDASVASVFFLKNENSINEDQSKMRHKMINNVSFEAAFSPINSPDMNLLPDFFSAQTPHYKVGSWPCVDFQFFNLHHKFLKNCQKIQPMHRSFSSIITSDIGTNN